MPGGADAEDINGCDSSQTIAQAVWKETARPMLESNQAGQAGSCSAGRTQHGV